ncbi:unnamed protein product [Fusarium venenatum]|uniref:C2H2-type domain-containing protein n=1 Tax=Fusarium venenatum TaxID=56646 RepID=A0A2L2TBF1_9HYPO|nr:uncharacterized protein FVRRES_04702 [Fusarium venenatum]CEI60266.1 unnamed protein product [Fusarium venenatum]
MTSNAPPKLSSSNIQVNDNTSQCFNRVSSIPTPLSLRVSDSHTNRDNKPSPLAPKPPDACKEEQPDIRWFDGAWPCQSPHQVWSLDGALLQKEESSQPPGSSLKYMSGTTIGSEYPSNPDTLSFDIFEQYSGWPQSDSRTCITSSNPNKRPAKRGEGSEAPQKRSRTSEHDENAGEVNEDGDHRMGGDDADNRRGQTFACPYYRIDPERFLECINLRMPRISDVKQHLKRRHTARYYCLRCSKGFSSQKVYEDHIRQANCSRVSAANLECVSPAAQEAIKVRFERSLSSKDQWNKIWEVLFGKRNPTVNPYLDNIFKEVTGIIRGVWKKEGDQIISSSIKGRELPSCSDQLHSLLLEFLNKVETRFEQKPPETNSRESPLHFDISLVQDMVGANLEPILLPAAEHPSSSDDVFSSYAISSETSNLPVNFSRVGSEGTLQSIKKLFTFPLGTSMQQVEYPHMDFSTTDLQLPGETEPWNFVDSLRDDSADTSLPFFHLTEDPQVLEGEPHLNIPNN